MPLAAPGDAGKPFAITFFSTLLATSILDVSTDGLAIDILNDNERGTVNGLMWAFRTFGLSLSGISSAYIMANYGLTNAVLFIGFFITLISYCLVISPTVATTEAFPGLFVDRMPMLFILITLSFVELNTTF